MQLFNSPFHEPMLSLIHIWVDSLRKAKDLPCVFNNWGIFYNGIFETVNLTDAAGIQRILKNNA